MLGRAKESHTIERRITFQVLQVRDREDLLIDQRKSEGQKNALL